MPLFRIAPALLLSLAVAAQSSAQSLAVATITIGLQGHGHHGGGGGPVSQPPTSHSIPAIGPHGHHGGSPQFPGAGNVINYNPGIYYGFGVGGGYTYSPSLFVGSGSGWGFAPIPYQDQTGVGFGFAAGAGAPGGLMLASPPRVGAAPTARRTRPNPARSKELIELGDRAFRGGNTKRAEERYLSAIKADPIAVIPHVHLAQLALVRGKYKEAADSFRTAAAMGAGTNWLVNAPDIQAIFSEPGDFARHLAKLESYLQTNPGDRDAWFVLGAEWYLSGRSRQAADVFQRLTDRQPDPALAAFLDVASPPKPETR